MRLNNLHIMVYATLSFLLVGSKDIFSQDPQFSQFYAASLYLNPAFTGNTIQGRVAGNYRKQWPRVPGAYTSSAFSYDQNFNKYKSGVGILLISDKAGSGSLKFTSVGGLYSYHLAIKRNLSVRAGARASHIIRSVDISALTFTDQFVRDDPNSSVENIERSKISYLDIAAGSIIYSDRFWFGVSVNHLNTPNQSFTGISSDLPMIFSAHGGYNIDLQKNEKDLVTKSLTLGMNYNSQQNWDQLDLGVNFTQNSFVTGIWYRGIPLLKAYKPLYSNNDALIAVIGYTVKDYLTIGYSYDLTISKLGMGTLGSHEISIIYEFAQPEYKRDGMKKNFLIPCTKF
ncbi:MAG: type IX secretion system membrane protein PorP/SprF [Flavobacteriales bacterium]|nr:type IX secretion system membrane protein PorP/SprF [Flavobacteriales bacterium]